MSCPPKTSPGAPTGSNSHPRPTKPSSGSAHNSQFPPPQISPPPNPVLPQAANSPTQSSSLHPSPRSRFLSSPHPHPPNPPSHPRSRCPPPAQSAPPHNSRSSAPDSSSWSPSCPLPPQPPLPPLPPIARRLPHPTPAATSASHRKSSRPPESSVLLHRSTHTPAPAPPPTPPPHEIPATRVAGETAQAPPNSSLPSPRSAHSPAPPHFFPAAAAASALSLLLQTPLRLQSARLQVLRKPSSGHLQTKSRQQ